MNKTFSKVWLNESDHRYYHKDTGDEFMSVSAFKNLFKKQFDPNAAIRCAGKDEYEGMTASEVKEFWNDYKEERCEIGTKIHDTIEVYSKTTQIKDPKDKVWLLSIQSQYNDYHRIFDEQILYDEENKLAGKVDRAMAITSSKKSVIDITDWKTNEKGILQYRLSRKGEKIRMPMLHCLSHLVDCTYNDYCLQLSTYAYMIEKNTDHRIGQLNIHFINTKNPLINTKIPVPYMKYEVEAMLQYKAEAPIIVPNNKPSIIDQWDSI